MTRLRELTEAAVAARGAVGHHGCLTALDMHISVDTAEVILAGLNAERAAGEARCAEKALGAMRREKAALDQVEALRAAHAAEVAKLKAEIAGLDEALAQEVE